MHELGVLRYVVKTVAQVAKENKIEQIKFITLEVGTESSYGPYYLNKLFPIAIQYYPEIEIIAVSAKTGEGIDKKGRTLF